MKNKIFGIIFTLLILLANSGHVFAINYEVLVLPTELFKVCDNYFCYPETSEIMANYLINNLNGYGTISVPDLYSVRKTISKSQDLKTETLSLLDNYKQTNSINFATLNKISKVFNTKSVILVSTYTITDKAPIKRDLWDVLEISSAFRTTYPFTLQTNVVLTDTVNNVVMWSGKYSKSLSDTNGYFGIKTQAQAASQLEKIKDYYKNFISVSAAQNIHLRFFPKDVRTITINKNSEENQDKPQYMPNALDNLIKPKMLRELDEGYENTQDSADDYIFAF